MGPTVSQMFSHHTGSVTNATHVAASGAGSGLWIWLVVLVVLAGLFIWVRRGLRNGPADGHLSRGYMGPRPSVPPPTGGGGFADLLAGGFARVASTVRGIGRSGRGASGEILRRVGLSQEGNLRVESRVQLAPGRWLVRVHTGEETLLVSVGPDVQVIGSRPDAHPPGGGSGGDGAAAAGWTGPAGPAADRPDPSGGAFARILAESLTRMGQDGRGPGA